MTYADDESKGVFHMDKISANAPQPNGMNIASVIGAAFLLCILPIASRWRFPGGTPSGWYWCAIFSVALLIFNIYALKVLSRAKLASRLLIYVSLAVGIYIFVVLFQLEKDRKIEAKSRRGVPIKYP